MRIPPQKQEEFLLKLHKIQTGDFQKIIDSGVSSLILQNICFLGAGAFIDSRGNLAVDFPNDRAPRLGMPFEAHLLSPNMPGDLHHSDWSLTLRDFIQAGEDRYLESSRVQVTVRKRAKAMQSSTIGLHGATERFANALHRLRKKGQTPRVLLTPPYPPTEYLENLIHFIKQNPLDAALNLPLGKGLESWRPTPLQSTDDKAAIILNALETEDELIIQGPPGTGKSHLMAEVCAARMQSGDAVCIVALANKALMEVAEKPALRSHLERGAIAKTNLQTHELKAIPEIEEAQNLAARKGTLLLTTYYKFSGWLQAMSHPQPIYDLLIIEEASQGFLATFAAFRRLARKVIIVGDPLQLPPIYDSSAAKQCHPNMERFARGLEYYAANSGSRAFILNSSYRFGPSAASMTAEFYSMNFKSALQANPAQLATVSHYNHLMPSDGGVLLHEMSIGSKGAYPKEAMTLIVDVVSELRKQHPTIEIAVLAPLVKTVTRLQDYCSRELDDFNGLTIETIDRIQGLTVDLTIYLLAFTNLKFAFDPNRFNVATSRARKGTIIITDSKWEMLPGIDPRVVRFLKRANRA